MNPYVSMQACMHGISASKVRLDRDEAHGAIYIYLDADGDMSIRVQVTPQAVDDPVRHAADLERDRKGLRRLAAVAAQAAQEIEQLQRTPDGAR